MDFYEICKKCKRIRQTKKGMYVFSMDNILEVSAVIELSKYCSSRICDGDKDIYRYLSIDSYKYTYIIIYNHSIKISPFLNYWYLRRSEIDNISVLFDELNKKGFNIDININTL